MLKLNLSAKVALLNLIASSHGYKADWSERNAADFDRILDLVTAVATRSVEPPRDPNYGDVWAVVDPQSDSEVAFRVCVGFRTLLSLLDVLSKDDRDLMPERPVWYSLVLTNDPEYLALIPDFDPLFFPQPQHVNLLIEVLMAVNEPGYGRGYYGFGDSGVGKTSTASWLFAVLGYAVISFNCKANMEPEELLVRVLPTAHADAPDTNVEGGAAAQALNRLVAATEKNNWSQCSGPLLEAVLRNIPFVVDELDLAPPELLPAINNLIERRNFAVSGFKDRFVRAGNGFKFFAFGNTGFLGDLNGNYQGRSTFDASFADRLYVDCYEDLNKEDYLKIINRNFDDARLSAEVKECFASFAAMLVASKNEGKLQQSLSPRALTAMIRLYLSVADYYKYPLMYALCVTMGCLIDPAAREAVFNVFTLSFAPLEIQTSCDVMYAERNALLCADAA